MVFLQLSSSNMLKTSTSGRRPVGSSSRDAVFGVNEADGSTGAGDPALQKVSSGHRSSPLVSSEQLRAFSARVTSNDHNLESTIKKIEGLNVSNEDRVQ